MKGTTAIGLFLGTLIGFFILNSVLSTCNTAVKMQDNAQKVVYDQYSPEALLKKYEWFKDASSQLDQKVATFQVYNDRFEKMKKGYGVDSLSRGKWAREDREQCNVWESEYAGIVASYNNLAAEYNAEMSKFNYRFCNKGDLPKGATEPVQREYREYKQ